MEFSPRKGTKANNRYCCVVGCNSKASRSRTLAFHRFPPPTEEAERVSELGVREVVKRREEWKRLLKIGKPISSTMVVCSLHFVKDDYFLPGTSAEKRKLKKTAFPSINLPLSSTDVPSKIRKKMDSSRARKERRDRRNFEIDPTPILSHEERNEANPDENDGINIGEDDRSRDEAAMALLQLQCGSPLPAPTADVAVNVSSGDLRPPFISLIMEDSKIKTLTGVPTVHLLNTLVRLLATVLIVTRKHVLSLEEQLLLSLMKIKLNLSYNFLGVLFNCTSNTCSNTFWAVIPKLAIMLKSVVVWPSKEEVLMNIPKCFKFFKKVRVVIDCTEISVMEPHCLKCRILTYSHYKGTHTVKYMVGVSPGGMITFLSQGYGGRASDKAIFEQSGIIEKLQPFHDAIMADKGFLIEKICTERGIELFRPPYLRKQQQFCSSDALRTRQIAKARVHVERVIQRLKQFAVLSGKLPWTLVPLVDDFMLIAAGITNLTSPILADDKF